MKPICVPCRRFFRPAKNGYYFIEGMPKPGQGEGNDRAKPGTAEPERWEPYKLWVGDLWRCEGCGAETIVGVAREPLAEHYQEDFAYKVERHRAELQVNDC